MLGVIAVQNKREAENPMKRAAQAISQNREAVTRVAQSGDARRLMELLGQEGGGAAGRPGGGRRRPQPADGHDEPADAHQ